MTVTKKSSKTRPERRTVSVISVPDARPDDGLFNPFKEAKAAESAQVASTETPIDEARTFEVPPTQPNPAQPIPTHPIPTQPNQIAAARDFNRRPNSIDRDALPAGLFPGTSQKLYNALFLKTRGAIVPTRTIQATKRELMEWSHIRSKNTIAVNLKILCSLGWIKAEHEMGNHEGSLYEVYTFEELSTQPDPTQPNPTQPGPTQPNPTQKLGLDPTQFLGWVGLGNVIENKGTYAVPKTSFNTKEENFDDEAFAKFSAKLKVAVKEVTGKDATAAEAERWGELADVLVAELKIAAARTNVSSVPSFLAEHLRRRLWKMDKKQALAEGTELPDQAAGALAAPNASECPDCLGTGWWYPNGQENGVAKCKHAGLERKESDESQNQQP